MNINVMVAEEGHTRYAEEICQEIYISSLERKTGIAKRTPEYINEKIRAGKFKVPKDQLLSGSQGGTPAPADSQSGFTVVNDDDLPF